MRPDLIVFKDEKPIFVVEVKKLNFDLHKSDFRSGKVQLKEYLASLGNVKWGMLTNGVEWRLYDFSNPLFGGVEIACFDLKTGDGDTFSTDKKSVEDLCYEIIDFHETFLSDKSWEDFSKEATAFSPESLAKAILSADVIKHIGRCIKGEHAFKANAEVLMDRVYWLVENGLNDAVIDWNESKAAELQKYVKSQKRSAKRAKKSPKKEEPSNSVNIVLQIVPEVAVAAPVAETDTKTGS